MKKNSHIILFILSALVTSCATKPTSTENVEKLNNMEGRYSKAEAIREFGEPSQACLDHTWTESCKWSVSSEEGRSLASTKSKKTLRLWFDKKGILVKKSFQ